jgi:hypothetical protein
VTATAVTRAAAGDATEVDVRFAWGSLAIGGFVFAVLVAFAPRYGYHRDELYFLEAGRHLAWGYPDQPPFVPLLAWLMNDLAPGSVTVLRLPSAIAAAAIVPLCAVLARQFGGERGAQLLAAGSIAVSLLLLGAGHTLSPTTFDLLAWVLILLLVVAILRGGDERLWLAVGLLAGAGLLDDDLVVFLLAGLLGGIVIAGPRHTFAQGGCGPAGSLPRRCGRRTLSGRPATAGRS